MIQIQELEGAHFRLPLASVPAGELVAVVAPTVACAREFVDLLLGLASPRHGAVRLFGQALAAIDEAGRLALRARLGFAAQAEGLVGHLALWENILLGAAYHHGQDAAALDARVRTLLGWCGWSEDEARQSFLRQPGQATPFERATAAWLRALLGEPELLVCEDLFGGLAAEQRRRLIEASVNFLSEDPERGSVFVLVGDRLVEELQPTSMFYLSLRGDFRAESQA
jgi:predicted ABC-type transport system involved in lysophospholipase L1 biosynthesis ATPase subunit